MNEVYRVDRIEEGEGREGGGGGAGRERGSGNNAAQHLQLGIV